ncbi:MAG: DUF4430 domain-containing protein [Euryarchaeota archaeon]|nr:DUF4430 domain-containing protein [Euryarchaeota archaeon]
MHTDRTLTLLTALALLTLALPLDATAEETATVTLVVEVPEGVFTNTYKGYESFTWTDTVGYTDGLTALDLLDQVATARGSTYTAVWYDIDGDGQEDDAFIDEIDGVASDFTLLLFGYYWALYDNGAYASTGAAGLVVDAGDTVTLRYEGWPASV